MMKKFPSKTWDIRYSPDRGRWETYLIPQDWPFALYRWLWDSFGHPGSDPEDGVVSNWDYHGGWIYFYDEKLVTAFLLRWS
jgi:hypothetical protein